MATETVGQTTGRLAREPADVPLPDPAGRSAGLPLRAYMRPAKWTGAWRRRSFLAQLPGAVELHPCDGIKHVGTSYGGWPVPLGLLDEDSLVYSVGAGQDISFDHGLIERLGCEVHSFDPTAGAAAHVRANAHERLSFHNLAIWTRDGTLRMHRAADPAHIALSAVNLQQTTATVTVPCRSIESIRRQLGHERIDLLKLTVDGAEYELLPALRLASWGTRVLVVAFHHNRPARDALAAIAALAAEGMVPVARRATAFTFVRRG